MAIHCRSITPHAIFLRGPPQPTLMITRSMTATTGGRWELLTVRLQSFRKTHKGLMPIYYGSAATKQLQPFGIKEPNECSILFFSCCPRDCANSGKRI